MAQKTAVKTQNKEIINLKKKVRQLELKNESFKKETTELKTKLKSLSKKAPLSTMDKKCVSVKYGAKASLVAVLEGGVVFEFPHPEPCPFEQNKTYTLQVW